MADQDTKTPELLKAGLGAVSISVGINAVLFLVGDALGAFPPDAIAPGPEGQARAITLGPVVTLSAAGPAVGLAIWATLRRFTAHAWMVFLWMAVAVLLIMAVPPFLIQNAPMTQVVLLEAMHGVTAVATIGMAARTR